MEFIENYRLNRKPHVFGMSRSRSAFQILGYQPKRWRSLGRHFKRWHETI